MTDDQLGQRIIERDETAMTVFYRRHEKHVFGKAWRRGASEDTANTIVSESMLGIWRHADKFDPNKGTFRMFFWGIAKHRISAELLRERRLKRRMIVPDSDYLQTIAHNDSDHLCEKEIEEAVDTVILLMKPHHRLALRLFHFEGYSLKEVARILNQPHYNIVGYLTAARKRISRSGRLRNLIEGV